MKLVHKESIRNITANGQIFQYHIPLDKEGCYQLAVIPGITRHAGGTHTVPSVHVSWDDHLTGNPESGQIGWDDFTNFTWPISICLKHNSNLTISVQGYQSSGSPSLQMGYEIYLWNMDEETLAEAEIRDIVEEELRRMQQDLADELDKVVDELKDINQTVKDESGHMRSDVNDEFTQLKNKLTNDFRDLIRAVGEVSIAVAVERISKNEAIFLASSDLLSTGISIPSEYDQVYIDRATEQADKLWDKVMEAIRKLQARKSQK